jgi:nitroreductase
VASAPDRSAVDAALTLAVRAPSIHNTQPWRWRLSGDGLDLLADRTRQLAVADPDGHSLLISCGAALHLTELGLHAAGLAVETETRPDESEPDLLARFTVTGTSEPSAAVLAQADAALRRRSDRRPFAGRDLPPEVTDVLRAAAAVEDLYVDFPNTEDERINLAVAVSRANRTQQQDEALRQEMASWLRDPEVHASDGVLLSSVPHVEPGHQRHTDVPVRDFEIGLDGRQMIDLDVDEKPTIAVVLAHGDGPRNHLLAGVSMMRLMVAAELAGLGTCPLSQAVDLSDFRARVQTALGWVGMPQMMLRIGYPGGAAEDLPRTPRREVSAVLTRTAG